MANGPEWFAPKRYGIGSGLPIRWQGWVVLALYLAVVGGTVARWHDRPAIAVSLMLVATLFLVVVSARTTRGGWRWRWGGDD